MLIIYTRHHHYGEKVVLEETKRGVFTKTISGKRLLPFITAPTILIATLFLSEKFNFYISTLIFVLWFIATDIFRARKTIYGTYISRWFYTSQISINNNKWRLNISDDDFWPSVPHMHATGAALKLDIYTGVIYSAITKQPMQTAKEKDLRKLFLDNKLKKEIVRARIIYKEKNPNFDLVPMPAYISED
jgi:hypothetical protein